MFQKISLTVFVMQFDLCFYANVANGTFTIAAKVHRSEWYFYLSCYSAIYRSEGNFTVPSVPSSSITQKNRLSIQFALSTIIIPDISFEDLFR